MRRAGRRTRLRYGASSGLAYVPPVARNYDMGSATEPTTDELDMGSATEPVTLVHDMGAAV